MSIKILYFASLREAIGKAEENIELPPDIHTAAALRDWLIAGGRDKLATMKNLRCAVNQELVNFDATIKAGDEIAFFPPVTGG